jgi:hypothetical protein
MCLGSRCCPPATPCGTVLPHHRLSLPHALIAAAMSYVTAASLHASRPPTEAACRHKRAPHTRPPGTGRTIADAMSTLVMSATSASNSHLGHETRRRLSRRHGSSVAGKTTRVALV